MAERAPEPGDTPVGGSRRPSRPPHSALPAGPSGDEGGANPADWPPSIRPILDKPPDAACPWLYLAADPDARAAFVTAEHRCEIRPDEVPGPGHQLAYCLTTNHISCPQLRSYEAHRRTEAVGAATESAYASPPPMATPPRPQPAVADFRTSLMGGAGRGGGRGSRGLGASRIVWAAAGAIGALVFAASLFLYGNPGSVASSEPDGETAGDPQPAVSQPSSRLSADELEPTSTPAAGLGVRSATDQSSDQEEATELESLRALGPGLNAAGPASTPEPDAAAAVGATPEATASPRPTYIVRPGDTLGQIAQNLGISVIDLAIANDITTSTLIFVGDRLFLPATEEATPLPTATPPGLPPSN